MFNPWYKLMVRDVSPLCGYSNQRPNCSTDNLSSFTPHTSCGTLTSRGIAHPPTTIQHVRRTQCSCWGMARRHPNHRIMLDRGRKIVQSVHMWTNKIIPIGGGLAPSPFVHHKLSTPSEAGWGDSFFLILQSLPTHIGGVPTHHGGGRTVTVRTQPIAELQIQFSPFTDIVCGPPTVGSPSCRSSTSSTVSLKAHSNGGSLGPWVVH